jgi:hypothetical protein
MRTFFLIFLMTCSTHGVFSEDFVEGEKKVKKRKMPSVSIPDREALDDYFIEFPFFRLPVIGVPVIKNNQWISTFFIHLEGEAASREVYDDIRIFMLKITDAIFTDLYQYLCIFWFQEDPVSAKNMVSRAHDQIEKILGTKTIKKIFVRDSYMKNNIRTYVE